MATITTQKLVDHLRKLDIRGVQVEQLTFATGTDAADGDDFAMVDIPSGFGVVAVALSVDGSLGTAVTLQARAGTAALTAATTAGGASTVFQNAIDEPDSSAARTLNLLVGGGAITIDATVVVQYALAPVDRRSVPV